MKNRIEVNFDSVQFAVATASLQENVSKYKKLINCIEKIIGLREVQPLEQIDKFITDSTGFKNILLSATLLEVSSELQFIQENIDKINYDALDISEDVITTKQSVLDKLKEDSTMYLSDKHINEYNTLAKACCELNKLQNPNSSNYLKRDHNGKYTINAMMLENSSRI